MMDHSFSPEKWHQRFILQACWTAYLRRYLVDKMNLDVSAQILETGCGTGAITASLNGFLKPDIHGVDLRLDFLKIARRNDPSSKFMAADVFHLPFMTGGFQAVVCHFFLLWLIQPESALAEMKRVTRPGGWVAALAEPDYGGRIDYPVSLSEIGRLQGYALKQQGADPNMGRKLASLFHEAGLKQVETGILGAEWGGNDDSTVRESEWALLESDLHGLISPETLSALKAVDSAAWSKGERVLFVPTFWAIGKV